MAKRGIILAIWTTNQSPGIIHIRAGTFAGAPGRGAVKGSKALLVGRTFNILTGILHTGTVLDQIDLSLQFALSTESLTVVVVGKLVRAADWLYALGTLEITLTARLLVLVQNTNRPQAAFQLLAGDRGFCKEISGQYGGYINDKVVFSRLRG